MIVLKLRRAFGSEIETCHNIVDSFFNCFTMESITLEDNSTINLRFRLGDTNFACIYDGYIQNGGAFIIKQYRVLPLPQESETLLNTISNLDVNGIPKIFSLCKTQTDEDVFLIFEAPSNTLYTLSDRLKELPFSEIEVQCIINDIFQIVYQLNQNHIGIESLSKDSILLDSKLSAYLIEFQPCFEFLGSPSDWEKQKKHLLNFIEIIYPQINDSPIKAYFEPNADVYQFKMSETYLYLGSSQPLVDFYRDLKFSDNSQSIFAHQYLKHPEIIPFLDDF